MHILYVSQYFPPEMGAPSARVFELSREWVRLGHRVTVLTAFAHHPVGIKAPEDRWRLTRRESHEGIEVVRSYVYAAPNEGVVRRMVSYASFMASASLVGLARTRHVDIVVATSPQLLCSCAGYLLARFKRVPFVFEVRDLWPESILAVSAMRNNVVVRSLRSIARHLYEHSDRIVTVGPGYREEIRERYGIPGDRITVVPNGVDPDVFVPGPKDNEVRRRYGWTARMVFMYVGTLGMAHALETVIETAATFRDDPEKLFVLVGEGAQKEDLQQQATARGLVNVVFIDGQPKQRIPLFYAACDIGLVTLRDHELFRSVLPSKIFEYMAMERPVIASVGGDAGRLVADSGGGISVPPEDPEALRDAIERLSGDAELADMGRRGRAFVLAEYSRRSQAREYASMIESVLRQ